MPLTGGQITGYDGERLAFAFTMMNGDEAVPLPDQRRRDG